MKFFIDTADLDDIREAASWGCLSGVTTNPSLYAKTGGKLADFEAHMVKICEIVGPDVPVSAESTAETCEEMIAETMNTAVPISSGMSLLSRTNPVRARVMFVYSMPSNVTDSARAKKIIKSSASNRSTR